VLLVVLALGAGIDVFAGCNVEDVGGRDIRAFTPVFRRLSRRAGYAKSIDGG
jgi:hypothetical protein